MSSSYTCSISIYNDHSVVITITKRAQTSIFDNCKNSDKHNKIETLTIKICRDTQQQKI